MRRRTFLGLLLLAAALSGCGAQVATPVSQPTAAPASTSVTTAPLPATPPPAAATSAPAPAATSALPAPIQDPQPATDPLDLAQRFMAALQADPSGQQAAQYAGGNLAQALQSGTPGLDVLLGEPVPFGSFTVDKVAAAAPPFTYVQVTIAYGDPPQPRATRIIEVKDEGGLLRVSAITPAALDDPALSEEQQARNAAAQFLALLSAGRYQEAVGRFAGDLAPVLAQNPDLTGDPVNDLELRGRLLERACAPTTGACLAQRRIVYAEPTGEGAFTVWVEFNQPDGGLYQRPADGATTIGLRFQRTDYGWMALDLPPSGL